MSRLYVSWDWLWSFYNQASDDSKRDILRQLNIEEVLQYGSIRVRKEIFEHAPQDVIKAYRSVDQLRNEIQNIIRR